MKHWKFLAVLAAAMMQSCSESTPETPEQEPGLPEITSAEVSEIAENYAVLSGELISDGEAMLIDKGIVFGKEAELDLESGTKVSAGRAPGKFSVKLEKLEDWTEYHVRTYATNSVGTAYGEDMVFETLPKKVRIVSLDGVIFKMVYVEGGTFTMGAAADDASAKSYEKPAHKVTLDSYYIGQCEVTNDVWNMVMEGRAPELIEQNERYLPVMQKSWVECQEFIMKLNALTGMSFAFPTEAQWEYAARGGAKSAGYLYSGSNDIGNVGWYYANALSNVMIVGTKYPNELGLYDMTGNVLEWCEDWYDLYTAADQTNPVCDVRNENGFKVMRGGSVINDPELCRTTHRFGGDLNSHMFFAGFRLALGR